MKRNLFLFSLLVTILGFTYLYEEVGHIQKDKKADDASRVLNFSLMGNLKRYETPFVQLEAKGGYFETKNPSYLADAEKVEALFNILSYIKISRLLTEEEKKNLDESNFFPNKDLWFSLIMEKGEVRVLLGKKLSVDRTFYIKMKRSDQAGENWALAYDDSPVEGVYSESEEKTNDDKYRRLGSLLTLKTEFFFDAHPLKKVGTFDKISIENMRNRPFTIEPQKRSTGPAVLSGLSFSSEAYQIFMEELTKLKAKELDLKPDLKKLKDSIAKMTFSTAQNKTLTLELFKTYGKKTGYFIKSNTEEIVFEMDQNAPRLFFTNVQSFWNKSLSPWETREFSLIGLGQKFDFKLNEKGRFEVLQKMKINEVTLKQLWDFLPVNADRVEELEEKEAIPESQFILSFKDHQLYFYSQGSELHVIEPKLRLRFVYMVGELPVNLKLMDYFR